VHGTPVRFAVPLLLAFAACHPDAEPLQPAAPGELAGSASATVAPYSAGRAPEWEALFDRRSGWTGSDGIYSIPLSSDERPGSAASTETFFTFGDTFLGEVDDADRRSSGSVLINNTTGHLIGGAPDASKLSFHWRTSGATPQAWVVPTDSKKWYWMQDGVVANGKLYNFALRMRRAAVVGFAVDGVDLLSGSASQRPLLQTYTRTQTPFYVGRSGSLGEMYLGAGVLPNTAEAGAPNPDGYLYVYGTRNDRGNKKLVVARVRPAEIETASAYRYWDGATWQTQLARAAPITDRVSSELSVTPLADGRFLLVFMLDALGRDVAVRYGNSPVGPWGAPISVWSAPEPNLDPDVYTYNAKAHPHLSAPGELLISYNVNSFAWEDHFANADIYRPRFVRLPLN
jgi:hypothetical protein